MSGATTPSGVASAPHHRSWLMMTTRLHPRNTTMASTNQPERELSDLNDLEIAEMTRALKDSLAGTRPLVGELEPLASLADEYEGAPTFLAKISGLGKDGWTGVRRLRGDGDCFYRGEWRTTLRRSQNRELMAACAQRAFVQHLRLRTWRGCSRRARRRRRARSTRWRACCRSSTRPTLPRTCVFPSFKHPYNPSHPRTAATTTSTTHSACSSSPSPPPQPRVRPQPRYSPRSTTPKLRTRSSSFFASSPRPTLKRTRTTSPRSCSASRTTQGSSRVAHRLWRSSAGSTSR